MNAGGLFTDTVSEPFVLAARPKKCRRKRGKRAGVLVRLRRRAFRPPLPTILLANVQSLDNKFCEPRARITYQRETRDCCFICLTETRMSAMVPDLAIELTGFLTGRSQVVPILGNNTSSPLTLNTGAPKGCVLSPLLYSLYTHDCTATHGSNVICKFADDTTVIGLISDNDETAYREEVSTLTKWCQENHLSLNIDKTGGGFQETEQRTHTHHHRQDTCGAGKQL